MAIVNLVLRLSSLLFLIGTIEFGWGLHAPIREHLAKIHPEKELSALAASAFISKFLFPLIAGAHLALATITGYGATFFAPKDKVKLLRGLFLYWAVATYLVGKDIAQGKTQFFTDMNAAYAYAGISGFFTLISFILSFTSGGAPTHQAAGSHTKKIDSSTPAKTKKAQ